MKINENDPGAAGSRHFQKTKDGKQILRDAMATTLPKDVSKAEKQGFSSPDASWFKGDSIDFVKRRLLGSGHRYERYLDAKSIQSLVNEHVSGEQNRRLLVWSLLNFEEWLEKYDS